MRCLFLVLSSGFLSSGVLSSGVLFGWCPEEAQLRYRVMGNLGLGATIPSFLSSAHWKWYFPPEVTASERHLLHIATMSGSAFLLSAQEMPKVSLHYPDN